MARLFHPKDLESFQKVTKDCTVIPILPAIYLKTGQKIRPKPTPLEIYTVYHELKAIAIPIQMARKYKSYIPRTQIEQMLDIPSNKIVLRSYQQEMIKLCSDKLRKYSTLLTKFPPGFGKTIMAISLWRMIRMRCVILINRVTLVESWLSTIKSCLRFDPSEVNSRPVKIWVPGSDNQEDKFYSDPVNQADFIICMVKRVSKIPKETIDKIGFMIVDEGHLFCTQTHIPALTAFQPNFVIFATATPYRNNSADKMIDMFVDKRSWVSVQSKRPYIVDAVYTGINLDSLCIHSEVEPTFMNKYSQAHQNSERNELIIDLINQAYQCNKKCMVLTTTRQHVEILSELTSSLLECATHACYYGDIKTCSNYDILFGTVPKIGTGYDEATACIDFDGVKSNVLILCTSVKSLGLFEQLVGRVMRSSSPHIVLLIDDDSIPKTHFSGLKEYINRTNGIIQKHFVNKLDQMSITEQRKLTPFQLQELINDKTVKIDFLKARTMGPKDPEYVLDVWKIKVICVLTTHILLRFKSESQRSHTDPKLRVRALLVLHRLHHLASYIHCNKSNRASLLEPLDTWEQTVSSE